MGGGEGVMKTDHEREMMEYPEGSYSQYGRYVIPRFTARAVRTGSLQLPGRCDVVNQIQVTPLISITGVR